MRGEIRFLLDDAPRRLMQIDPTMTVLDYLRLEERLVGTRWTDLGRARHGRITVRDVPVARLAAMGAWLKANGEAIYGTTKSPVGTLPNGRLTHRPAGRTLYFHVYDWPAAGVESSSRP